VGRIQEYADQVSVCQFRGPANDHGGVPLRTWPLPCWPPKKRSSAVADAQEPLVKKRLHLRRPKARNMPSHNPESRRGFSLKERSSTAPAKAANCRRAFSVSGLEMFPETVSASNGLTTKWDKRLQRTIMKSHPQTSVPGMAKRAGFTKLRQTARNTAGFPQKSPKPCSIKGVVLTTC